MKPLLPVAIVIAALVGGYWVWLDHELSNRLIDVPPAISGTVSGPNLERRPLTDAELIAISTWFATHRQGWSAQLATPPTPATIVELQHRDGLTTEIDIYYRPPSLWDGVVELREVATGKLVNAGLKKLSADEVKNLLRLVGR